MRANSQTIYLTVAAVFLVYFINFLLAGKVLGKNVVVPTNYTLLNNVICFLGLLAAGFGASFMVLQGPFADEDIIPPLLLGFGLVGAVTAVTGSVGAMRKNLTLVSVNLSALSAILGAMAAAAVLMFQRGENVNDIVREMGTDEKRQVGMDLGIATLSDEELERELEQTFRRMGMLLGISVLLILIIIVSGCFYASFLRDFNSQIKQVKPVAALKR